MKKLYSVKNITFLIIGLIGVIILIMTLQSEYVLTFSTYKLLMRQATSNLRIVHLSDLHNSQFGEDNSRLVKKVQEQSPDFILMTGDMINTYEEDVSIGLDLVSKLVKIAPVYYSYGNHEVEYETLYSTPLREKIEQAGAKVLDFEYEDVVINGQAIRIGGMFGYALPEGPENIHQERELEFLQEFQQTEEYKILLCHMPHGWLSYENIEYWNIDLVLAGHLHGGQIIVPFIGGVYAPDQGWFPGKVWGMYSSEDTTRNLIITRGLGTSKHFIRFNNTPEIVVVELNAVD